ncbi:hypothetical protein WA158_003636 [Blastocystis sp. Blastoise]
MTEYWVNLPKYLCKYCNTWIQDNVPCRKSHEGSERHKKNVKRYLTKQKEDREKDVLNAEKTDHLIEKLKRIADQKSAEDAKYFSGTEVNTSVSVKPPKTNTSGQYSYLNSSSSSNQIVYNVNKNIELSNVSADVSQQYNYSGYTYPYMSSMNDYNQYYTNTYIPPPPPPNLSSYIYTPEISTTNEVTSSNNSIVTKETKEISDTQIISSISLDNNKEKSDDNNIDIGSQKDETNSDGIKSSNTNKVNTTVEDDDFFGGWTTVAVNTVTHEDLKQRDQEYSEAIMSSDKLVKETKEKEEKEKRKEELELEGDQDHEPENEDAFSTFNPYGGAYKGVVLTDTKAPKEVPMFAKKINLNLNKPKVESIDFKLIKKNTDKKKTGNRSYRPRSDS